MPIHTTPEEIGNISRNVVSGVIGWAGSLTKVAAYLTIPCAIVALHQGIDRSGLADEAKIAEITATMPEKPLVEYITARTTLCPGEMVGSVTGASKITIKEVAPIPQLQGLYDITTRGSMDVTFNKKLSPENRLTELVCMNAVELKYETTDKGMKITVPIGAFRASVMDRGFSASTYNVSFGGVLAPTAIGDTITETLPDGKLKDLVTNADGQTATRLLTNSAQGTAREAAIGGFVEKCSEQALQPELLSTTSQPIENGVRTNAVGPLAQAAAQGLAGDAIIHYDLLNKDKKGSMTMDEIEVIYVGSSITNIDIEGQKIVDESIATLKNTLKNELNVESNISVTSGDVTCEIKPGAYDPVVEQARITAETEMAGK